MTKRLYYEDAYKKEFEARVTGCVRVENGYEVTLDQTAFYPEGGGQPCDLGILEPVSVAGEPGARGKAAGKPAGVAGEPGGSGKEAGKPAGSAADEAGGSGNAASGMDSLTGEKSTVAVLDVQEVSGEVRHLCDGPAEVGARVRGRLDWERRIRNMREHSGEHILSGIICRTHGYSNIGFHMGKDCVTIDFNGRLTTEEIRAAEKAANEKVLEDVEITAEYPGEKELETLEYRSKKELEGKVRIVTIPGADVCACCGTHVRRTGEIGPIKVIASEHYKNGIRLSILIGQKALEDYAQRFENTWKISTILSVKPENTAVAVEKLAESMNALKLEYGALKMQLLEQKVEAIPDGTVSAVLFEQGLTPVDVRKLADRLQEKAGFAAVFCGSDEEGYKYVICSKTADVAAFGKAFNQALCGRGGGRNPMIQGSVAAGRGQIEEFLEAQGIACR